MSIVNIIEDDLFVSSGQKLNGTLKRFAKDFRVTELHEKINDLGRNGIAVEAVNDGLIVKEKKSDGLVGLDTLEGDYLIEEIVGATNLKLISDANSECQRILVSVQNGGKSSEIESVSLLLPRGMSKLRRGLLHKTIKEGYPFLMTATLTSEECLKIDSDDDNEDHNDKDERIEDYADDNRHSTNVTEDILHSIESASGAPLSPSALTGIKISADWSLLELCHTSLSMVDITAVYAYKGLGPYHKEAGQL